MMRPMPRRTRWAAAAAALALAASVPSGGSAVAVPQDQPASGVSGRGAWRVDQLAPDRYAVAWTSPTRLPVTSDRPTVVGPGEWAIGTSTVAADGRTVSARIDAPERPDPARLDVVLSGARLDATGADRARLPAAPRDPLLDLPGTVTLATDPATPGPYAVVSSDYELAPVPVPGLAEPVEMVGHVVEPAAEAATGPRPLVLFMHGRHGYCYDPSDKHDASDEWPCRAPYREIPSQLGYDYVQRVLASQGYATVSVRVNGINAQDDSAADGGADARARLVQAHLDHWVGLAAAHQVDLTRVVLVGHSRGGEGVNRAAIRIPLTAAYRIVGQVLIAPTDFASQTAPYVPTVTLLPYCDGDVSDLQGQRFTDLARDLTVDDTAFRSSVLVMGANHNFFNTEWTPATAHAAAGDDWYGSADRTCGRRDPARLSAGEQRAVGTAYVAGAVHLFAGGDQRALPLFDGSRARVASQGPAQTLSHAIGGGRDLRTPGGSTALALAEGASTRFCRGVLVDGRVAACGDGVGMVAAAPMWPQSGEGLPPRDFFEMEWTAAGQSGGMLLRSPLDLSGRRLELRTIVEDRGGASVRVRLTDATGATALLDPVGGPRLPGLGRSGDTRKLWAQTVVVDPAGTALDLTRVTRVDLVGASSRGRVWVADLAAAPAQVPVVPARRLPTVDVGRVRLPEGAGGRRVARLPFRVNGTLTEPASIVVSTAGQTLRGNQRFRIDLAPGQTGGSIPVAYEADHRADFPRLVTQVVAWGSRNVVTDHYAGSLTVLDDDPRPRVTIRAVSRRVVEGEPVRWRIRLNRRVDYGVSVLGKVLRGPGPQVQVGDLGRDWTDLYVGPVDPRRPLWRTHTVTYDEIAPGGRTLLVTIPTRADRDAEPPETLTLRIQAERRTVRSTVRVVDP
jgi:dienelactone hydrolase